MAEFINTIDLLGDDVVAGMIVERTIEEFCDDTVANIGAYAFYQCLALRNVNLPSVTLIGDTAFGFCSALESAKLPSVVRIDSSAFYGCSVLKTIILRSDTVCSLSGIYAFYDTPFASNGTGGTVYVPSALISQYQNATNWSTLYAAGTCNFVAIEGSEYE